MKKVFRLEDLDCANCAAKMEAAIAKLDGINFVNVNFLMQTMTLETENEISADLLKKIVKTARKINPDCRIIL